MLYLYHKIRGFIMFYRVYVIIEAETQEEAMQGFEEMNKDDLNFNIEEIEE
jgi:hypothetical protein